MRSRGFLRNLRRHPSKSPERHGGANRLLLLLTSEVAVDRCDTVGVPRANALCSKRTGLCTRIIPIDHMLAESGNVTLDVQYRYKSWPKNAGSQGCRKYKICDCLEHAEGKPLGPHRRPMTRKVIHAREHGALQRRKKTKKNKHLYELCKGSIPPSPMPPSNVDAYKARHFSHPGDITASTAVLRTSYSRTNFYSPRHQTGSCPNDYTLKLLPQHRYAARLQHARNAVTLHIHDTHALSSWAFALLCCFRLALLCDGIGMRSRAGPRSVRHGRPQNEQQT